MDLNTEEVRHIHMKSGIGGLLHEDWRIRPGQVIPDIVSWIKNNLVPLSPLEVRDLDLTSYCVSARRIWTTLRIVEPVTTRLLWILCRALGFVRVTSVENKTETQFSAIIDPIRLLKRMRKLRPLRKPIEALLRSSVTPVLKRVTAQHLVKLKDMSRRDICLVFPRDGRKPVVVVKYGRHLGIPLELGFDKASEWYSRV